jgi:hypothetical protein
MAAERLNFTFDGRPPRVVGWDQKFTYQEEVHNYKAKPIRVEIRHVIPGDIELEAEAATLHDFQTVQLALTVEAQHKLAWQYGYTQHLSKNAKQNSIRLK